MKIRALTLGAVIGFVVAFAPSCGQSKCGPANCDGCCDANGACVKKPSNNNNSTCGLSGNTCSNCTTTGQTCNAGVCTGTTTTGGGTGTGGGTATGGGTGTGGGTNSCDGCRLPNGTCVPSNLSASNTTNCGLGGGTCNTCASGQLCTNGTCGAPDAGSVGIGSACNTNADCSAVPLTATDRSYGIVAYCKKASLDVTGTAPFNYTGGYCTKRCGFEETANSSSCGSDFCSFYFGDLGESDNVCFKSCTADSQCRNDYYCLPISQTEGVCMPQTMLNTLPDGGLELRNADAGVGFSGAAAQPCTADGTCQPPADGFCISANLPDGGATGYTDGQCSAICSGVWTDDSWCGTGGSCVPEFAGRDALGAPAVLWFCEQACGRGSDGGTLGTCRQGYACTGATNGYCSPRCDNPGQGCGNGFTCNATTGQCE